MKKLLLAASLGLASFGQAQQKTDFGLKAGLNTSSIKGAPGFGIYLGGLGRIPINEKWSFQPELLYTYNNGNYEANGKGFSEMYIKPPYNFTGDIMNFDYTYTHEISYHNIAIPVMLAYQVNKKFGVSAGLQLNFMLSDSNTAKIELRDMQLIDGSRFDKAFSSASFSFDDKKIALKDPDGSVTYMNADFKRKSIGLAANLGATYDLNAKVFFEGRVSIGLTNFVDSANAMAATINRREPIQNGPVAEAVVTLDKNSRNIGLSNTNIQLGVGYRF